MADRSPTWVNPREAFDRTLVSGESVSVNSAATCTELLATFRDATPRWMSYGKAVEILKNPRAHCWRLVHIPKSGGTTVAQYFGWTFQGHVTMEENVNRSYPRRGAPFFTLLRHPVERSLSAYYFMQSGRHQSRTAWMARQARFCKPGTGRFENATEPCVPRLSPYEWLRCADPERSSEPHCAAARELSIESAQYQFEFLRPARNSTLADVVRVLSKRFFLVGVTELLPTFLPLASRALGIPPKDSSYGPSMRVKVTPHPPVAEVFTEEQYRELAQQRRVDLALYSWARARLERVAQCMNVSVVWSKLN